VAFKFVKLLLKVVNGDTEAFLDITAVGENTNAEMSTAEGLELTSGLC